MRSFFFLLAGLVLILCACQSAPIPADLILVGGRVLTLGEGIEPEQPSAIAIRDDRIFYVGEDEQALAFRDDDTRIIELDGATVIPGFHDSHCHLYGLGKALAEIDLMGTDSPAEVAARVTTGMTSHPGEGWLQGRGWDQNDWTVQEYPTRALLDPVTGSRPCLLRRVDGHAALANSAALEAAGINSDTPDPEGGEILRDADGQPTGLLIDNAVDLVRAVIPQPSAEEVRHRVELAVQHCLAHGITAVTEAGVPWSRAQLYQEMAAAGELDLRVFGMYDDTEETLVPALAAGPVFTEDHLVTLRAIKLYADGALGSRGALLHRDYCDHAGHRGLAVSSADHLRAQAQRAAQAGFQVGTHAIGDRANTLVLDIYQEIMTAEKLEDPRWRIEHAQILTQADIPRFAELGVIAAMQPVHCTSDMDWAGDRLCEDRLPGAYAWRSLLDSGAHVCWGTDFPVEKVSALDGLYAARTRTHHDGTPPGGWQAQEKVDARTALELYTVASAYAAFLEDELGRIEVGYLADLTVLDGDPVACAPAALLDMKILQTIVQGRVVYTAP
jgi:predicted amidohydrolase YtcJ|nr:amidohydrolase family protein [Candidatus Krumholzibacteria bacterium]